MFTVVICRYGLAMLKTRADLYRDYVGVGVGASTQKRKNGDYDQIFIIFTAS